jgi:N utilization substance protein B
MALRKQPRSIARELALLSISQIKTKQGKLTEEDLDSLVLAAIRTLTIEVQDNLEVASGELKRGEERLLNSQTRASDLDSAKVMIQEALAVSQAAINRVGMAVEFPEFLQLTNKEQVRQYATELIVTVNDYRQEIEAAIENVLVGWQLSRLAKIDRDILRISVAEMLYLQVPEKVAINESVELAKRYSDEDGFRFINGVLRRLSDRRKGIVEEPVAELETAETAKILTPPEIEEIESSAKASPQAILPIVQQTQQDYSNQE